MDIRLREGRFLAPCSRLRQKGLRVILRVRVPPYHRKQPAFSWSSSARRRLFFFWANATHRGSIVRKELCLQRTLISGQPVVKWRFFRARRLLELSSFGLVPSCLYREGILPALWCIFPAISRRCLFGTIGASPSFVDHGYAKKTDRRHCLSSLEEKKACCLCYLIKKLCAFLIDDAQGFRLSRWKACLHMFSWKAW